MENLTLNPEWNDFYQKAYPGINITRNAPPALPLTHNQPAPNTNLPSHILPILGIICLGLIAGIVIYYSTTAVHTQEKERIYS